jgi:3-oxoacyl-[acyl-carrier protein] reductase
MVDLSNKLAVVSGGARDIGRAVVLQLAQCGASVAFCYYESADAARQLSAELERSGARSLAAKVDATKSADVNAFIEKVHNMFHRPIDILVNNAGGLIARKKLDEMDEAFWDLVMAVNLKSAFLMCKAAASRMSDGGAIINISSQAARDGGGPGAIAYATSKGALSTFTRGLAKELGTRRIRVNAVCPGMIATAFHDKFTKPEVRQRVAAMTPLGREGACEEVAALVAYLASAEASYINGACLDINGGLIFS